MTYSLRFLFLEGGGLFCFFFFITFDGVESLLLVPCSTITPGSASSMLSNHSWGGGDLCLSVVSHESQTSYPYYFSGLSVFIFII